MKTIFPTLVTLATIFLAKQTTASPVVSEVVSNAAAVCGVPAIEPIPPVERIVGGVEAKPNSWPWMCLLEVKDVDEWDQWCGCSVLNNVTLLTAAHCINDRGSYRVRCGIHYQVGSNPHEQTVLVSNYTYHELFDKPADDDYDVGILKLATPLTFNDFVSPVCLPQNDVEPGTTVVATGWGCSAEYGNTTNELRQVAVPVVSQKQCIQDYGTAITITITDRMLCAGNPEGGKDTCQGDSGGPLVTKRDGVWEIQGITSWGKGCAEKGYPGVYTRVTQLMDWIKQRL